MDNASGIESQNELGADSENVRINGSEAISEDGDQQKKARKISVNSGQLNSKTSNEEPAPSESSDIGLDKT